MLWAVVAAVAFLLALTAGRALPDPPPSFPLGNFTVPSLGEHPFNVTFDSSQIFPNLGADHQTAAWTPPAPATNAEWQRAVCKGSTLLRGMAYSDEDAGQLLTPPRTSAASEWDDPQDIRKWGYHIEYGSAIHATYIRFREFWGITTPLASLGVSTEPQENGGKNWVYHMTHGKPGHIDPRPVFMQTYVAEGQTYRCTGAISAYSLNREEGVIMAMHRVAPKNAAPFLTANQLPKLQKSSDLLFLMWRFFAGDTYVKNVRYFFSLSISNEPTSKLMVRAVGTVRAWPGSTFTYYQDEFRALLGSPNGVGLGYFLMQHKERLGLKTVYAVRVWLCDSPSQNPCMLFYLQDLAEPAAPS